MLAKIINERTIHVYDKTQFDPYQIRHSGQIFRDPPCTITEHPEHFEITATCPAPAETLWHFFDFDTDYNAIKAQLEKFPYMRAPIASGGGIRILRQPFVECVISFIVSANNNIRRFTKTLAQIDFSHLEKYTQSDFKTMGCGYRAPYLAAAVQQLKTLDFAALDKMDNQTLRKTLMQIRGVGRKVADCIMLFAFHRLDTAPVDTHIHRAIETLGAKNSAEIFSHPYAGIAQQYIFYYLQHLQKDI
jgi:N-glycosylase/DNA lyase